MDEPVVPERPRLAPGVRLHFDKTRSAWVLLCPEKVIEAGGPANEIIRRCDGMHTVAAIIDELAVLYAADRDVIAQDVKDMMTDLAGKGLLVV
jgi:pyrroloquinoline quinone biosynthesis protein D